jgi:phage terminase large subunit GpA-like protein
VFPIKGAPGMSRPIIDKAGSRTRTGRLFIVGVDAGKAWLFARLARPGAFRLSAELPEVWHEQVASERAVVRYRRGQPMRSFERIPGKRAEALDCCVYAVAARQMIAPDWQARRTALAGGAPLEARPKVVTESRWMQR